MEKSLEIQVGGAHYKSMKMQPVELIVKCNLDFFQGNFVKYISRYKNKNGREDLEKCLHYIQLRKELIGCKCTRCVAKHIKLYCNKNEFSEIVAQAIFHMVLADYDKAEEFVKQIIEEEYGR